CVRPVKRARNPGFLRSKAPSRSSRRLQQDDEDDQQDDEDRQEYGCAVMHVAATIPPRSEDLVKPERLHEIFGTSSRGFRTAGRGSPQTNQGGPMKHK